MNTTENNKLIAEFMGIVYPKLDNVIVIDNVVIKEDELQYHTSWDWLMPVAEKIERQHKANFEIKCLWNEFIECSIYQVIVNIEQGEMSKDRACIYDPKKIYQYIGDAVKCKREATYKAVVEFIKEYNTKNK